MTAMQWKQLDENGDKVLSSEVQSMPKWLIHPFHPGFRAFLYCTVVMAALTGAPGSRMHRHDCGERPPCVVLPVILLSDSAKQALTITPFCMVVAAPWLRNYIMPCEHPKHIAIRMALTVCCGAVRFHHALCRRIPVGPRALVSCFGKNPQPRPITCMQP